MTSSLYRRLTIRYLAIYLCGICNHRFEQETRGYQGFYVGCLLFFGLGTGLLINYGHLTAVELFVVGFVFVLLLVPVYRNVRLVKTEKVAVRFGGSRLLPNETGRRLLGRILGGDSKIYGFLLALVVVTIAVSLTVGFSAVITVSATMI